MTGPDPVVNLERMIDAARRAVTYGAGLSEQDFLDDARTQDAVCMCLMAIGECAKRLTRENPEFIAAHGLNWSEMARMRDRIAHGYETLDMSVVWATVDEDLVPLLSRLESILAALPRADHPKPD